MELCDVTRQAALANPLLKFDDLLVTGFSNSDGWYHMVDQYAGFRAHPGGGLYVLRNFKGCPTLVDVLAKSVLTNGPLKGKALVGGAYLRPDLSFDARRIVFAWNNIKDRCYHIYTVNVDGSNLTALTDGPVNYYQPGYEDSSHNDFDPIWMPDGRIVFISERRGGYQRCTNNRPIMNYVLHSMKDDGSDLIRISYHETNEWDPSVDRDGKIVYTRWDYIDRDDCIAHHLWTCYPDGRDPRGPHGNYPLPLSFEGRRCHGQVVDTLAGDLGHEPWTPEECNKINGRVWRPIGEWYIRAIPNSAKYIATAAGHHLHSFGHLVMIDTRLPDDGKMQQVKGITTGQSEFNDTPEDEFGAAWPLSEDFYLTTHRQNLLLLDRFGNMELLCPASRDPGQVRPCDVPDSARSPADAACNSVCDAAGRASGRRRRVRLGEHHQRLRGRHADAAGHADQVAAGHPGDPTAQLAHGRAAAGLRHGEPRAHAAGRRAGGGRRQRAASGRPSGGKSTSNFWTSEAWRCGRCGRGRSCIQARPSVAPAATSRPTIPPRGRRQVPLAFRRAPSELAPEVADGAIPFNWHRLAEPVLKARCAACHAREKKGPDMSYASLEPYSFHYVFGLQGYSNGCQVVDGSRSLPGKFGAMASRLFKHLDASHHGVSLTPDEFRRITLWLDCNSNELGAYTNPEAQRRGEIVWPEIDVDPTNPLGLEHPPSQERVPSTRPSSSTTRPPRR